MPIMLGIDDIAVSGYKPSSFVFEEPKTAVIEEQKVTVSLKHYRLGESLAIRTRLSGSNPDRVAAMVTRFDKPETMTDTLELKRGADGWSLEKPLDLAAGKYAPGLYEITFMGFKGTTKTVETVLAFMVVDDRLMEGHPRLWFSGETKETFSRRMTAKHPETLEYIRREAADARQRYTADLPYDLEHFPTKGWLSSFEAYRTRIATIPTRAFENALVYAVDGDKEAAAWAKKALVNLCKWPTWTHPWMKDRGHHIYLYQVYTTRELAMVYDILYDLLSESERDTVRKAFFRNGLEPAYRSYVLADMVTNNESNWITAVTGGPIIAACSIIGDLKDSSELEPYLTGCLYKMRSHMRTVYSGDSGCIEGFSYGFGTMRHYSEILPVIENTLGLDMMWMFENAWQEALWAADHDRGVYFTFGDAHLSGGNAFSCLPWLAERFKDPSLGWFMDMNKTTPTPYTIQNVLFDTDNVPRKRPELSGAKWFKTTGTVVFRSDNGPDPFVFTFRSGPFGNHQHLDQGTFYLHDRGETLVTEMGYSNYYDDPFYQSHVIQPIGHNCILVDGYPHSQRTGDHAGYAIGMDSNAGIREFAGGSSLAWALGDLTKLYMGNVGYLTRGILYVPPRTVLVLDRLMTLDGEATIDVLFHGPKMKDMTAGNGSFSIRSGSQTLAGMVVVPSFNRMSLDADPVKLAMFTDNPIEPMGRVTITSDTSKGMGMSAVLLSTENRIRGTVEMSGTRAIEIDGAKIVLNPSGEMRANDAIGTDGILAALSDDGAFLMVSGTEAAIAANTIARADSPVTLLIEGDFIHYSSDNDNVIHLSSEKKVFGVLINGLLSANWKRRPDNGLSIPVVAGIGLIELRKESPR